MRLFNVRSALGEKENYFSEVSMEYRNDEFFTSLKAIRDHLRTWQKSGEAKGHDIEHVYDVLNSLEQWTTKTQAKREHAEEEASKALGSLAQLSPVEAIRIIHRAGRRVGLP